jgi:septal ring factor EnvC (AmiA/AmiB activator)
MVLGADKCTMQLKLFGSLYCLLLSLLCSDARTSQTHLADKLRETSFELKQCCADLELQRKENKTLRQELQNYIVTHSDFRSDLQALKESK